MPVPQHCSSGGINHVVGRGDKGRHIGTRLGPEQDSREWMNFCQGLVSAEVINCELTPADGGKKDHEKTAPDQAFLVAGNLLIITNFNL